MGHTPLVLFLICTCVGNGAPQTAALRRDCEVCSPLPAGSAEEGLSDLSSWMGWDGMGRDLPHHSHRDSSSSQGAQVTLPLSHQPYSTGSWVKSAGANHAVSLPGKEGNPPQLLPGASCCSLVLQPGMVPAAGTARDGLSGHSLGEWPCPQCSAAATLPIVVAARSGVAWMPQAGSQICPWGTWDFTTQTKPCRKAFVSKAKPDRGGGCKAGDTSTSGNFRKPCVFKGIPEQNKSLLK